MARLIPDVIGRYKVERAIGAGGMGTLYLARDPAIDRYVAIKLLREGLDDAELRERFKREARSAGRLHHPTIVTIFDVGEDDGSPFIAMEFVRGETLADVIRRRAPILLDLKLQWIEELCGGLHFAHREGVVHRDVKPANVMVNGDGVAKILDFGIARFDDTGMTHGMIGSVNYVAPEQMEGRAVDARTDIFSLGALFYELLTYQRAFPGDISSGVLTKILAGQPTPLESIVPGLDPQLSAIVGRCLEKRPEDRYPDCAALRRDVAVVRGRLQADTEQRVTTVLHAGKAENQAAARPGLALPYANKGEEQLPIQAERIGAELRGAATPSDSFGADPGMAAPAKSIVTSALRAMRSAVAASAPSLSSRGPAAVVVTLAVLAALAVIVVVWPFRSTLTTDPVVTTSPPPLTERPPTAAVDLKGRLTLPALLTEQAPTTYDARFATSKGDFFIHVNREWAPESADRFYNLVKNGFYDNCRFYWVVTTAPAVWFGINGDPTIQAAWQREAFTPHDAARGGVSRGSVAFSLQPDRPTQVLINLKDNYTEHAVFGEVSSGMDVLDALTTKYALLPDQRRMLAEGNPYLIKAFPDLDYITTATIQPPK